jgi:urea transport system permease protein
MTKTPASAVRPALAQRTRQRPSPGLVRPAMMVGLAVALAVVPSISGDHLTALLGRILVFGLLAMSLDLVWGYAGQLSLGHAAFFGLGAYATGLVLVRGEGVAVTYAAIAVGILVPALAGLVLASLLFQGRVSGVYFAIVTLLVSLLLEQLAITWVGFTGGINGLFGMAPVDLGLVTIRSLDSAYYLIVIVVVAAFAATWWLTRTSFGRTLRAIRSNEHRAHSLGYPVITIKTVTFTISCALAGLAGVLYVPLERFVYPTQMGLVASTAVIVWVVIGGRATLVGPFLGAFAVEYLASVLSGQLQAYWTLAIGIFLVVVVLAFPGGIVGVLTAGWRRAVVPIRGARWRRRA